MIRAAKEGAQALGIRLSRAQYEAANRRMARPAWWARARRLRDYRDLRGERFDRIASIGMVEHVGRKTARVFPRRLYRTGPGGLFLNHGICDQSPQRKGRPNEFVERYSFPTANCCRSPTASPSRSVAVSKCATWRICASTTRARCARG